MKHRVWTHRITYGEIDGQHIAFNAHYLAWIDAAQYEFFRLGGWGPNDLTAIGMDHVVVSAALDFLRPLHLDEVIHLAVEPSCVGRSSFSLNTEILSGDTVKASARLTYVNVRHGRSTPIPEVVSQFLRENLPSEA